MKKYSISGMSCAACVSRIEKAVKSVPGVTTCSVNLLTRTMVAEYDASSKDIIAAIENIGYKAVPLDDSSALSANEDLIQREESILKKRLLHSLIFLIPILYTGLGISIFHLPSPSSIIHDGNDFLIIGYTQLLFSTIVLFINRQFFINGIKGILHGSSNMDTLVALGAGTSFFYSFILLLTRHLDQVHPQSSTPLYFEGAAMIVSLITVGKYLEGISKGKTTNAIKGLIQIAPQTITLLKKETVNEKIQETEKIVPVDSVSIGDVFIIKPGERIPVDGLILEGSSSIDESALTGESLPVEKIPGDKIISGTLNQNGFLKCKATHVGKDTTISQIIQLVSEATASKPPIAKIADKISGIFVPAVISIAIITCCIWLLVGAELSFALTKSISILVISCPCALGLATPVAIMVGNGVGAKNGILFKISSAFESIGKTNIIAFDKTGTITNGNPEVTDIVPTENCDAEELLLVAKTIEAKSEHPLSKAITNYQKETYDKNLLPVRSFEALPGYGLKAILDTDYGEYKSGDIILGGSLAFISSEKKVSSNLLKKAEEFGNLGKTPLFFSINQTVLGIIAVADTVKKESKQAINELKHMGIHTVMLTGDNQHTANVIASQVGVDEFVAEVLPSDKEHIVKELMEHGTVTMVGDGINDAPALTRADVGIAIGASSDITIDAADIVLMKNKLTDIPAAIRLSKATMRNIHQNLFWAFFYNAIGIPLAAGCFYKVLGWSLPASFGAAAMSLSSFCVVSNALRLNLLHIYDSSRDKKSTCHITGKLIHYQKVSTMNQTTYKVDGMMCSHCEAAVKKALEAIDGITEATADHKSGTVKVSYKKNISKETVKKAVTAAGYDFKE